MATVLYCIVCSFVDYGFNRVVISGRGVKRAGEFERTNGGDGGGGTEDGEEDWWSFGVGPGI